MPSSLDGIRGGIKDTCSLLLVITFLFFMDTFIRKSYCERQGAYCERQGAYCERQGAYSTCIGEK